MALCVERNEELMVAESHPLERAIERMLNQGNCIQFVNTGK